MGAFHQRCDSNSHVCQEQLSCTLKKWVGRGWYVTIWEDHLTHVIFIWGENSAHNEYKYLLQVVYNYIINSLCVLNLFNHGRFSSRLQTVKISCSLCHCCYLHFPSRCLTCQWVCGWSSSHAKKIPQTSDPKSLLNKSSIFQPFSSIKDAAIHNMHHLPRWFPALGQLGLTGMFAMTTSLCPGQNNGGQWLEGSCFGIKCPRETICLVPVIAFCEPACNLKTA